MCVFVGEKSIPGCMQESLLAGCRGSLECQDRDGIGYIQGECMTAILLVHIPNKYFVAYVLVLCRKFRGNIKQYCHFDSLNVQIL